MLAYYFTKQDLYGIPRGHVERFFEHRAAGLLREQAIEPFDPKNPRHKAAPGAKDALEFAAAQQKSH